MTEKLNVLPKVIANMTIQEYRLHMENVLGTIADSLSQQTDDINKLDKATTAIAEIVDILEPLKQKKLVKIVKNHEEILERNLEKGILK